MRFASVLVPLVALMSACGESSFSGDPADSSDASSSDSSSADSSSDAGFSEDGGSHDSVALRGFSPSEGDLLTTDGGENAIMLKVPGGTQASDVVVAVIALYPVGGADTTTMVVAPPSWQPADSFFKVVQGGNASFQWHLFAFATQVTAAGETANFAVTGLPLYGYPSRWYAALVAYSGASLATVELKDISSTSAQVPYVSFSSVIVGADGSHVFGGLVAQYDIPRPLIGLPPDVTEVGGGFMTGFGRLTDRAVPSATTLPAYRLPTGADDAGPIPNYSSTAFQFVIAPAK